MYAPSLPASGRPSRPVTQAARQSRRLWHKRPLDLLLTLPGLVALLPVFLIVALAIKLTSPGPVFFVQTRVGLLGKPFGILKFRSMYQDAEARRAAVLAMSDREGLCFKSRNDPRITPIGRFLRRFSIDELPQLFNVVKGDMSLVGPRPALPEEVENYPLAALERLAVLPGITGVWQVSGRAEIGFDEMIELDIGYVRQGGLLSDLSILARTAGAVIGGRGAF
jgi:lipopolysaccharide/colanic/teichoic acid biosynthesis glycosyltransferase